MPLSQESKIAYERAMTLKHRALTSVETCWSFMVDKSETTLDDIYAASFHMIDVNIYLEDNEALYEVRKQIIKNKISQLIKDYIDGKE